MEDEYDKVALLSNKEAAWLMTLLSMTYKYIPQEQKSMANHMMETLSIQFLNEKISLEKKEVLLH